MPKLLNNTICLIFLLSFISCQKITNLEPVTSIAKENYFETEEDMDNAARGMYDGLQNMVEKMLVWGTVQGDLIKPAKGANYQIEQIFEHNATAENPYTNWAEAYETINRANHIIKYAKKAQLSDFQFTEDEEKQFVAEAISVRALTYFYLIRTFGNVPFILEPFEEITKAKNFKLTSQKVIADTLIAQLQRYEGIERSFPQEIYNGSPVVSVYSSRMKAITNLCLQTEIFLWQNEYAKAVNSAKKAINTNEELYSIGKQGDANVCYASKMEPKPSWRNIFAKNNLKPETIFEIQFQYKTPDLNCLQRFTSKKASEGGEYIIKPSEFAIKNWESQKFAKNDRKLPSPDWGDYFRGIGHSYKGDYNRKTGKLKGDAEIWKYICGANGETRRQAHQSEANWIIYRMGDLILMYAEALNRAGQPEKALGLINGEWDGKTEWIIDETYRKQGIRKRVLIQPIKPDVITMEAVEDIIINERALELAFEGKRWFDLLRIARRGRTDYMLKQISQNMPEEKQAEIKERLKYPKNWYLPYNSKDAKYLTLD